VGSRVGGGKKPKHSIEKPKYQEETNNVLKNSHTKAILPLIAFFANWDLSNKH
jgi:hypothetical protein